MEIHWYIYKDYQVEGPYSLEELKQEVDAGRVNSVDLIWNPTMSAWLEANQIQNLENSFWPKASSFRPQPSKFKDFLYNLNYQQIAIILVAAFLLSVGATSIYLYIAQNSQAANDDLEDLLSYSIQFEENEKQDLENKEDEISKKPTSEQKKEQNDQDNAETEKRDIEESLPDHDKEPPITTPEEAQNQEQPAETEEQEVTDPPKQDYVTEDTLSWLGGTYTGPLLDDTPHGEGVWRHPDGRSYTGDFTQGEITGYGTMTFSSGERYIGSFLEGKFHGDGTLIHPRGKKYVGEFKHGIIEGYGTMTFPDGERYIGYFKNGLAHGRGTMTHPDGRSVSGIWSNGKLTDKD